VPALWLGVYAVCISYGYLFIGAAPGTVVFYCAVLVTLIGYDRSPAWPWRRGGWSARRWRSPGWPCWRWRGGGVTVLGVALLAATGITWGLWYACQRSISATTAGTVQLVIPVLTAAGAVEARRAAVGRSVRGDRARRGGMWLARPASPAAP
jgi:hypothetical protein